jgi:FkbM family methyltransferase
MKILQIGCNHGKDHVLDFYKENYKSIDQLILIDASIDAISECQETYENNDKCTFLHYAVTITSESFVKFYQPLNETKSGHASLNKEHTICHLHPEVYDTIVPAININNLLEQYMSIDRLYIDVEGLDAQLVSSINFSKYKIPYIFFEFVHSDGAFNIGTNFERAINVLINNGYKLNKIDTNIEASL